MIGDLARRLRTKVLAITLTNVDTAGNLIRAERETLGLSTRHLASLAGLSYPTISRIENGHEQPRWETMQKIAAALGKSFGFNDLRYPRLADLAAHHSSGADCEPDWTRLRTFVDEMRLRPELTAAATADRPPPSGSPLVDNLLAAIAEKLADDQGIRRPRWTAALPALDARWEAPGTPRKREANAAQTPSQFAERNISLPASAIWRDRELVRA